MQILHDIHIRHAKRALGTLATAALTRSLMTECRDCIMLLFSWPQSTVTADMLPGSPELPEPALLAMPGADGATKVEAAGASVPLLMLACAGSVDPAAV